MQAPVSEMVLGATHNPPRCSWFLTSLSPQRDVDAPCLQNEARIRYIGFVAVLTTLSAHTDELLPLVPLLGILRWRLVHGYERVVGLSKLARHRHGSKCLPDYWTVRCELYNRQHLWR